MEEVADLRRIPGEKVAEEAAASVDAEDMVEAMEGGANMAGAVSAAGDPAPTASQNRLANLLRSSLQHQARSQSRSPATIAGTIFTFRLQIDTLDAKTRNPTADLQEVLWTKLFFVGWNPMD